MTFQQMIEARNLTVQEAQKLSGISPETFKVLLDGGRTIPQLALKVGRGLHLTQEEVKQLGKTLDRAEWKRLELPVPPAIDGDPLWYEKVDKLPRPREKAKRKVDNPHAGMIRRIKIDATALKKAMDARGLRELDVKKIFYPNAEPKDRSRHWWVLKDKIQTGVGIMPDTARRLAEAIGTTVEEIGVEIWIGSKRWGKP